MDGLADVDSLIEKGNKHFESGDFKGSVYSYTKAASLCKGKNDKAYAIRLARAYNGIGHALRSEGRFTESKKFQTEALRRYKELVKGNSTLLPELAVSLHYMGDILADFKKAKASLPYYTEELRIAKRLYREKNKKGSALMVYGLNGMACRYADLGDYKKAVQLLNQSIDYITGSTKSKGKKLYPNLSWTYHIIGTTMLKGGNIDEAILNLKTAAKMRRVIVKDNKRFIAALKNTLNKLGEAYSEKGDKTSANRYFNETIKLIKGAAYKKQVSLQVRSRELRQLKRKITE